MSLYDFSFKTGTGFGQLYSPKDDTCLDEQYFNNLYLSSPDISGVNYTRLSCNGQTLVEQNATFVDAGFDGVYLNSGDYYFESGNTFRRVSFDSNFDTSNATNSAFFYNIKDEFRESPVGTGTSQLSKQGRLRNQLIVKFPDRTGTFTGLDSFDYFANGQKLYSGVSGSYSISGSPIIYFNYLDNTYSGNIFAITKNTGIKNYTGEVADVYGQKYVESTVFGYVNGVSLHPKNWLELSTGVTLIRTGLQPVIFEPIETTENIQL